MTKKNLISKDRLNEIANDIGRRYGFEDVSAKFAQFTDFKIKWVRTYKMADISVSDYLQSSPEYVVEELLDRILSTITGSKPNELSENAVEYLTGNEFKHNNQRKFLKRYTNKEEGDRLVDSYSRLVDRGYARPDRFKKIYWSEGNGDRAATSSRLMDAVFINSELKDADDDILDYAVLKGVAGTEFDFRGSPMQRGAEMQRIIDVYPESDEKQETLERMGLYNAKGRFLGWLKR